MFKALNKAGYDVVGVDRVGGKPAGFGMELDKTDVRKYFQSKGSRHQRFDLVVHCAAVAPHRLAIDKKSIVVGACNASLDAELFRWALKAKPGRIVYLSSSAAYPIKLQNDPGTARMLQESDVDLNQPEIGQPDSIYGWTKLCGEILAKAANDAGLDVTVVRPFSGYGEDQDARFPFGAFRHRAMRMDDPFAIWGDGEQVRDWIHVDDIVGGILAAVEAGITGPLNLGTGIPESINGVARMFAEEVDYSPRFEHVLHMPRGVAYRVSDPAELLKIYQPRISLEEGVRRALA